MKSIVLDKKLLKLKSSPVSSPEEANEIIAQLKETLSATPNGVGLAAIQIGIDKRVAILNCNGFVALINPVVIETDEAFIFPEEGCLSFPGLFVKTRRFKHFIIKNQRIVDGKFEEEILYFYFDEHSRSISLEAISAQHEIDHMDGIILPEIEVAVKKIGRNDPCPCGKKDKDGKPLKYKKCCLRN